MKLKEIAKNFNKHDTLAEGKEKMEIANLYNEICTITAFEFINSKKYNGESAIVIVKEYPNHFHFAGKLETDLLKMIYNDPEALEEFYNEGIRVKYSEGKSKNGQKFTLITVQD